MNNCVLLHKIHQKYLKWKWRKRAMIYRQAVLDRYTSMAGNNKISSGAIVLNTKLGYGSYIGQNSFIKNSTIGNYSCIAGNVSTVVGNHPSSKFVSIHPAFYSTRQQAGFTYVRQTLFQENNYLDIDKKIGVFIGSDVWIGEGVKILEGIKIGDGAIIATGAVVTRNVPPYAIFGGVPAKLLKYRFSPEEINYLLKLQWWTKDEKWIKQNAKYFIDCKILMEKIKE
ncbi:CatB-related O-acetyltransferase [Sporolactobacillus nakayamae]|uniref:Acetyltransferase (Isoleucine patch superfamily) n=1 Tax=Sporolactobacillus nakayamae TaxID=269670 RepID=A0A1I2W165_9BACL|nr:CatB-related O-acetyltransferase [Sporolactobacillus nakayamae]SFG94419.1 Acetyltransferase (isoleucine patch superfamily) [Sporolactobacillus nakayamae]